MGFVGGLGLGFGVGLGGIWRGLSGDVDGGFQWFWMGIWRGLDGVLEGIVYGFLQGVWWSTNGVWRVCERESGSASGCLKDPGAHVRKRRRVRFPKTALHELLLTGSWHLS